MANVFFITGTKENALIHLMSNRLLATSALMRSNSRRAANMRLSGLPICRFEACGMVISWPFRFAKAFKTEVN